MTAFDRLSNLISRAKANGNETAADQLEAELLTDENVHEPETNWADEYDDLGNEDPVFESDEEYERHIARLEGRAQEQDRLDVLAWEEEHPPVDCALRGIAPKFPRWQSGGKGLTQEEFIASLEDPPVED